MKGQQSVSESEVLKVISARDIRGVNENQVTCGYSTAHKSGTQSQTR